jgi:hypothetical protein
MKTFSPQISSKERSALANIRARASKYGYSLMGEDILASKIRKADLESFLPHIEWMPAEAYDNLVTRRRFVTYAHYYKPDEMAPTLLYFIEPRYDIDIGAKLFTYYLPQKYNPENFQARSFAPLPEIAQKHRFLLQIIEAGFHAVPLRDEYRKLPLEVEIQFIRYEPRRKTDAIGTPPTTHQDNDWAFCVLLLEWVDIQGPENAFVPLEHVNKSMKDIPEEDITRIYLVSALSGYSVEDTKVAHYVGPVSLKQGSEYGRRTILILSYKPLVPLRPADIKQTLEMVQQHPEVLEHAAQPQESITIDAATSASREPKSREQSAPTTYPSTDLGRTSLERASISASATTFKRARYA